MKSALRATLSALLSFLLASGPAGACCTDFMSCAGAVASGGLTCAMEAALLAVQLLIGQVKSERDAEKKAYEDGVIADTDDAKNVASGWKRLADEAAAAGRCSGARQPA